MVNFSGHPLVTLFGWLLLPVGIVILAQRVITNIKMNRDIQAEKKKTEEAERAKM